jgi:hypothetical protein
MLISAMGAASFKTSDVYKLSDGGFLSRLVKDSMARTQRLAGAYLSRRIFRPVYRIAYREESDSDSESKKLWRKYSKEWRDPEWRRETEEKIENYANLPAGSVAVYCPDRSMNLKEFEMLVQTEPGGDIKRLGRILDRSRKMEMDAINERFAPLWSLFVFVDPQALDATMVQSSAVQDFSATCEELFEFPNAHLDLQGTGRPLKEQIAHRVISEYEQSTKKQVPYDVFEELVGAEHRGLGIDLIVETRKQLNSLMQAK